MDTWFCQAELRIKTTIRKEGNVRYQLASKYVNGITKKSSLNSLMPCGRIKILLGQLPGCHDAGDDSNKAILKLDSELVTYLNFLRPPEQMYKDKKNCIDIIKVGAASTESYQALECGVCFKILSKAKFDMQR